MKMKFFLLIAILALLAAGLATQREYWTLKPYETTAPYENISWAAADASGALYTIADSKRTLYKADPGGELVYALPSDPERSPGTIQLFNSVAADGAGNAYVLVTVLDSFGLKVSGERILQVSPDGKEQRILYEAEYDPSENLLRVGKLQSLTVQDGMLYFFRKEAAAAVLLRIAAEPFGASPSPDAAATGPAPEELRSYPLQPNQYLSELTGTDPNGFYFTTKRGRLYKAGESGTPELLYPSGGRQQLNFPVRVVTGDGRHVYFIDQHEQAVQRLDAGDAHYPVSSLLRMTQLAVQYDDVEWADFTHLSVGHGVITVATTNQIITLDAGGRILGWTDEYRFPQDVIWKRYAYWALIAATAAVVAAMLRFMYVHLMKRRVSLLVKQLGTIIPIILAAMIGLSYSVYAAFTNEMKEEMRSQLMLLAGNGKNLVDGERLERLQSPLDFMNDDYREIKRRMNDLLSHAGEDRDGLYSTVYRYVDGGLYIIMDDDDSVTMFQPFPTSEENLLVLEEGQVVAGEWFDETGEWLYALGPLYNNAGEIVGIYETGKDMNGVRQSHLAILSNVLRMIALISGVILLVVTAMTVWLLSSIRRLRRSVNLIASGEWDAAVQIRTRDEVAELGDRFNMMAGSIRRYIREVTTLSEAYFRFVPQPFLKVLGKKNMTEVQLGDQVHRSMTVLVCGMRDFASFSPKLTPEENFRFINSFLKMFGPVIRQFGGFNSRYTGPGMLALFPGDPSDALKAAVKLRETLVLYNEYRANSGYQPIDIGISIHIGDVMIGIIGEEQRMEGGVVSEQVRVAEVLERASAKLGAPILATEDALQSVKRTMRNEYRRLGAIQLYGVQRPLELYDVFAGDTEPVRRLKRETKTQFEEAVELYRSGRFYDAREKFVEIVKINRDDLAAKLYFFACDQYYQQGVTQDWDGALRVT